MGFEVEEFGINSIIIKAHPTWLPKGYETEAIKRIMELCGSYRSRLIIGIVCSMFYSIFNSL